MCEILTYRVQQWEQKRRVLIVEIACAVACNHTNITDAPSGPECFATGDVCLEHLCFGSFPSCNLLIKVL